MKPGQVLIFKVVYSGIKKNKGNEWIEGTGIIPFNTQDTIYKPRTWDYEESLWQVRGNPREGK